MQSVQYIELYRYVHIVLNRTKQPHKFPSKCNLHTAVLITYLYDMCRSFLASLPTLANILEIAIASMVDWITGVLTS